MSARKVLPLSVNKNNVRDGANVSSTSKLTKNFPNNSKMLGNSSKKSNNASQLNSTVCSIKSNLPSYIPQDAYFEADNTYSEYLQALAMKSISRKILTNVIIAWDTDICEKNEELFYKEKELMELEQKHQIHNMQITSDNLGIQLKANLDKWLCNIESNNLPDKINCIVKILNESCNKLELENINPPTTSTEYTKLSQNIAKYAEIVKSFEFHNEDSTALNLLAKEIKKYISLYNLVHEDNANLKSSSIDYIHQMYKTLSDRFAEESRNRHIYTL